MGRTEQFSLLQCLGGGGVADGLETFLGNLNANSGLTTDQAR